MATRTGRALAALCSAVLLSLLLVAGPASAAEGGVGRQDRSPVPAVQGPLPGAASSRALGLPAALAVVAVLGVASLLVRVLLAEPPDESADESADEPADEPPPEPTGPRSARC